MVKGSPGLNGFQPFLTPSGWFLGLGLFRNMFHNLLIYTNNFCFGYITVSCFFETFPGWLASWLGWLENPILMKSKSSVWTWTWTLDFNLGFVKISISNDKIRNRKACENVYERIDVYVVSFPGFRENCCSSEI